MTAARPPSTAGASADPRAIEPASAPRAFPLSFAQTRLWFLDQFQPGNPMYNVPLVLRLPGPLNLSVLDRALNAIVARHESLRTTFDLVDRKPAQIVARALELTLRVVDLRSTPAASREAEAQRRTFADCSTPFDLTTGPLIRATLLELSPTDHVLVLVIHHIVCDGWSMNIVYRELSTLYAAYASGRTPSLPEVPIQYADFAAWQTEWFSGPVLQTQLAYWRQQLEGLNPLLPLPMDRPRPAVQAHRGDLRPFTIEARLCDRIKALGQSEGATLFMTTLAAFYVLLYRYTGELDLVIGTPIANRTRPELEGLVGFFVNTLLLRVDLSGDPSFRQLLRRVRAVALGAYGHQDMPFEKLVEELQPARNPSHNPLFQVMFAVQNIAAPGRAAPTPAAAAPQAPMAANGTSKFDLTMSLFDTGRNTDGAVEYNTDVFDPDTIAQIIERFEILLRGIVDDPDRSIAALPVARGSELRTLTGGWSGARPEPLRHSSVAEVLGVHAAAMPDAPAVVTQDGAISRADLNLRVNRLARRLRSAGLAPEEPVVVVMGRSVDTVVALLAVLEAGGAFVPIDPGEPDARVAQILADVAPRIALTDDLSEARLPAGPVEIINVDREPDGREPGSAAALDARPRPRSTAAILYRSSPSGTPEGVTLTHEALLRIACGPALRIEATDRVAHVSSLLEDSALVEIFGALAAGATLVCLPASLPPRTLAERIREHTITVLFASTPVAERLAREFPWAFNDLRVVLCTDAGHVSESVQLDVVARLQRLFGAIEGGGYYTGQSLADPAPDDVKLRLGGPSPGVTLHLLDGNLLPVPEGMCGEVFVASAAVARGYRNSPDRTARSFVANPFGAEPPTLYRTGEFARRLADGSWAYLGRRDGRRNVRGIRVEAQEIEATLLRHPDVAEAAVIVGGASDSPRNGFVAFVAGARGAGLPPQDVRAFLEERLPRAMVPAAINVLDALPRAADGAVDRGALARRARAAERAPSAPPPYVPPRNDLETRLTRIWTHVFGLERIGVHDNFFQLGGHSLLATQVAARLSDEFDVDVPLQRLFDAPTIAEIATVLEPLIGAPDRTNTSALVPIPRDRPIPLSFAQQRLWFLDRFEPGNAFYNIAVNVRLPGSLDLPALRESVNELVARHESLRTTFDLVEGEPVQVIASSLTLEVGLADLRGLPAADREAEARRLATVEAQTPFDLRAGPVMRAQVLTLDNTRHVLLLTMHHIASDGWSMDVLFRELAALYDAHRAGHPATLADLPVQYADFAVWQRQWLAGAVLEEQLSYWKRQLEDAPAVLQLPTDRPRPPVQVFRGAMYPFALPASLGAMVKALSEQERVTFFMILLAAFDALLNRYTGQDDIVVGTPIANRTRPELEPLIGFFANTLALRTRIAPDLTFRQLLGHVREVTLGAYAHQDIPFEKLVEELQPERNLSHHPIFQVMVALQNIGNPKLDGADPGAGVPPMLIGTGVAKFDLTLFLTDSPSVIHAGFEYNSDLFDAATIIRMAGHLETLLTAAVEDPDRPLASLPLLQPAEILELQAWNATDAPFTAQCVHRMFEAQVERTPEAPAVLFDGTSVTYHHLNERANAWARRLIELGVEPDTLAAVALQRSVDMIVAVLAVLKAGGGYLPIDPSQPAERTNLVTADAAVRVVLTDARTQARLPAGEAPVVLVDGDVPAPGRADNPVVPVTPEHLAYAIYTSGSTGRPKGVAMPHRPLANLVEWQIRRSALPPGARTLQFASLSFDVSFQEIFATLGAGGTLVLIGEEERRDPAAVWTLLATAGVNRLFLPYVALQQLAERATRMATLPDALVEVITAGEQLQITPQIAALFARLARPLYNQYGPSETHVVTELKLSGDATRWPARPSIGRPISNATLHVLDAHGQPVPLGVPGEIYIGGAPVARGYLHRPQLTAERFVSDRGRAIASRGTLYRTGDRGRYAADGTIEFLGRLDDQTKIRGFRIEPAEIEIALRSHAAVHEAVVVARDSGAGEMVLVAYVKPDPAGPPSARELRLHLSRSLPEHMIPSTFVLLPSLPLTPTGKLDRRALPAPPSAGRPDDSTFVAPRTQIETVLAAIWCDVLRLPRVGVHDNFFERGGQSLLATRVLSRVQQELHVEIPLRRIFEEPTIDALAISIVEATLEAEDPAAAARLIGELEAISDEGARDLLLHHRPR